MTMMDKIPPFLRRFLTFGMVSAVGTVIDLIIVLTLIKFFGIPEWQALALSMLVSATVVYIGHELVTFDDAGTTSLRKRRWLSFAITAFAIYGFRVMVFGLLVSLGMPRMPALLVALVSSIIVNFTISRFAIFKPGRS